MGAAIQRVSCNILTLITEAQRLRVLGFGIPFFEPLCLSFLISTLDFLAISTFMCMVHASFITVPGSWEITDVS